MFAHQQRFANDDCRNELGLPLMLHLTKLANDCALPHEDPEQAEPGTTDIGDTPRGRSPGQRDRITRPTPCAGDPRNLVSYIARPAPTNATRRNTVDIGEPVIVPGRGPERPETGRFGILIAARRIRRLFNLGS